MANNTYTLPDISFVGSSTQYLIYNVFDANNQPIDLNGANCQFKLRQYGNFGDSAILTKTGELISSPNNNVFQVTLSSSDSIGIYGKFEQQIVVIDSNGKEFRNSGLITIHKAIT